MTAPLRITLLLPSISRSGGGVSEVARLLAHALSRHDGITLQVATLDTGQDQDEWPDVPIHQFKSFGSASYGFSPGLAWFMLRHRTDLVHVHGIWMFHVFAAVLWKARWRGPVVVTPHGMLEAWILSRSRRLKSAVSRLYQTRFLRKAEALQALTTKEAEDIRLAIGHSNTTVISNFLPATTDTPPEKPGWWRSEMSNRRIFLFLGRIHAKKGWRNLCEAWDVECRENAELREKAFLVFCGWPDDSPDFPEAVEELNSRWGNAIFAGPQFGADKAASLQSATVFVLPSESEGLPMAILEAWAAAKAVIMTPACNLNAGFKAGAAIETDTTTAGIRGALRHIMELDNAALGAMGAAGQILVQNQHSETAVTNQLIELYRGLTK